MVNVVIFGIGKTYEIRKKIFEENRDRINIVAFLDNNSDFQGKKVDEKVVYEPGKIKEINFDGVVILSKKFEKEMTNQLLAMGVKQNLIWNYNTLAHTALRGKRTCYVGKKDSCKLNKSKILIVTTYMGFNGGTMVAVHAAQALQNRGFEVMISAPSIDKKLLEEIVQAGISITVWDCLPCIYEEDKAWISYYDIVIVNVFQMMNCAYEISKIRPVMWWIHENRAAGTNLYQDTKKEFQTIDTSEWMDRVEVLGVSNIAKEAFNYYYSSVIDKVLPFGIPDRYVKNNIQVSHKSKIVFAVMAIFSTLKGQRVLVEAEKKLTQNEKREIEIWFIGPSGKNEQELKVICEEQDNMRFFGRLSHEEVIRILPQIDVLVCPSQIETMSMATIEGMMFKKLCITTDMTGVAEYIENGKNGFVVKVNNSDELAKCMSWIINNREKWSSIQKEARKTFEREFTLEIFGNRLETELNNCKEKFYAKNRNVFS